MGVINHVYNPYIMTEWTTSKKIWTEVQASAPYLLITLVSRAYLRHAFRRLLTTVGQFSYTDNITIPRYLKEVTGARSIP